MDIKKTIRISMLNDFYGKLLTDKEEKIIDDYFNGNISLGEIGKNLGISRQAVRDTVERAIKKLEEFENNLHLLLKFESQKAILSETKLSNEEKTKILSVWEN